MKKFASLFFSVVLVASMVISTAVSVFAASTEDAAQLGRISITKTDPETEKAVEGSIFSAWRILDFDGSVYTISEKFSDAGITVDEFMTDTGYVSYGTTDDLEAQISKVQSFALNNQVAADAEGVTDSEGQATLSKLPFDEADPNPTGLPLGVYLVAETTVPDGYIVSTQSFLAAVPEWNQSEGSWNYDISAEPKNINMQVVKTFSDGVSSDSFSIGDTINYEVAVNVPNYGMSADYANIKVTDNLAANDPDGKGVKKFNKLSLVFTDTLSKGLTLDESSIDITVGENTLAKAGNGEALKRLQKAEMSEGSVNLTFADGKDYTVNTTSNNDGSTTLVITISWASVNELQGQGIDIKYNAQLNNDAEPNVAANNAVTYEFSNDPMKVPADDIDDPTRTRTVDNNNFIYTYGMNLTKQFNSKSAVAAEVDASPVAFEIQDKEGKAMNLIKNGDGNYSIWTGNVENGIAVSIDNIQVGAVVTTANPTTEGILIVKGFKAGAYKLKETATVNDYALLTAPISVMVEEVFDEQDSTVLLPDVKASVLSSDGTYKDLANDDENKAIFKISVNNAKNQFRLPTTGGLGLWIFTVAGGVIMAGAIIFIS
ncbi:MAG: SpaA isopeptide-forming pilin-related protein, partial [Ruminococcus sp.]